MFLRVIAQKKIVLKILTGKNCLQSSSQSINQIESLYRRFYGALQLNYCSTD
jgi:hypothetical protein